MTMDENHPIYKAIDRGGGQTCDILGVIRELDKAGFVIVPRMKSIPDMNPYHIIVLVMILYDAGLHIAFLIKPISWWYANAFTFWPEFSTGLQELRK